MEIQLKLFEVNAKHPFDLTTHNGIITVHNTSRGTHRTFQIKTQKQDANFAPGERILSLLTGPDNTSDYTQMGFVKPDGSIILWKKFRTEGYEKLVGVLKNIEVWQERGFSYLLEGRCRRCNRRLTNPESISTGIGPECSKMG